MKVLKPSVKKKGKPARTPEASRPRDPRVGATALAMQWQADATCLLRRHEREKSRMARTVHDDLAQALTAMSLELSIWKKELDGGHQVSAKGVREKIAVLTGQLGGAINCAKAVSNKLQSRVLENFGLSAAIESLVKKWGQRTGRPADFSEDSRMEKLALDPFLSTQIFQLAEEVIEFRAQTGINRLRVRLTVQDKTLALVVEDDVLERSLTPEIHSRVRLLGGSLSLSKRQPIQIKVPLRAVE